MYPIFVPVIIALLSLFLETRITLHKSMSGLLVVSLLSLCLGNLFFRERVASINLSRLSRCWELLLVSKSSL